MFWHGLTAPATLLHMGGKHAPHLILYISHVPHMRNTIYTITSMLPEGSREPVFVSTLLQVFSISSYLELNLGLGNIGLTATSVGNLLGLSNLVLNSLSPGQP
jgi:hypothetical protein